MGLLQIMVSALQIEEEVNADNFFAEEWSNTRDDRSPLDGIWSISLKVLGMRRSYLFKSEHFLPRYRLRLPRVGPMTWDKVGIREPKGSNHDDSQPQSVICIVLRLFQHMSLEMDPPASTSRRDTFRVVDHKHFLLVKISKLFKVLIFYRLIPPNTINAGKTPRCRSRWWEI